MAIQEIHLETRHKSAAHRDKSQEWGRLKAKVEPHSTLGNSGYLDPFGVVRLPPQEASINGVPTAGRDASQAVSPSGVGSTFGVGSTLETGSIFGAGRPAGVQSVNAKSTPRNGHYRHSLSLTRSLVHAHTLRRSLSLTHTLSHSLSLSLKHMPAFRSGLLEGASLRTSMSFDAAKVNACA